MEENALLKNALLVSFDVPNHFTSVTLKEVLILKNKIKTSSLPNVKNGTIIHIIEVCMDQSY